MKGRGPLFLKILDPPLLIDSVQYSQVKFKAYRVYSGEIFFCCIFLKGVAHSMMHDIELAGTILMVMFFALQWGCRKFDHDDIGAPSNGK